MIENQKAVHKMARGIGGSKKLWNFNLRNNCNLMPKYLINGI
jgi:hypothetical protein